LPMAVGFIRTPIFTRYFSAEEYGIYGIIFITHSILSIFFFTWISNCLWRFYHNYLSRNKLNELYTNLLFVKFFTTLLFLVITLSWTFVSKDILTKRLIFLLFLQFLSSGFTSYMMLIFRIEGFSKRFNVITIIRVFLQFGLQYFFAFHTDLRIESLPLGIFIVDVLSIMFLTFRYFTKIEIRIRFVSKSILKELYSYTSVIIISNLSILFLTSIDRYLIAIFGNINEVGIYNQVYNISQLSMMSFVNLFFAIVNPKFIKEMENNLGGTNMLTSIYITVYIIAALPIVVYFSFYSDFLAKALLGKEFYSGYTMIPFVMFSSFIYGITMFFETRIKFASAYKKILKGFIIATLINLVLNCILIPLFNYQWAAVTTLFSYIILFIIFLRYDIKLNNFSFSGIKTILPPIYIIIAETVIHFVLEYFRGDNKTVIFSLIEVGIFFILYFIIVFRYSLLPIITFKNQYK